MSNETKTKLKSVIPFLALIVVAVAAIFVVPESSFDPASITDPATKAPVYTYNSGDIAWMLVSCAFVFLMTPALAFFYGGMVGRKNVLSTMIKSTVAAGIISVLWIIVQFSLCFGDSIGAVKETLADGTVKVIRGGFFGDPSTFFMFKNVMSGKPWSLATTIPLPLFAFFQLMFAIITPGLVVGAVAERIRFSSYTLFIVLFAILVYSPLAHMAWHPDGLMFQWGVLDFAGGTVVHISAGCAALAGALVLKPRKTLATAGPANIPYVLIGTGLLWFGWFGFNAGSAVGSGSLAVYAFATTNTAAAAAGLSWMFFDVIRGKKPSVLGFCIGAVVGLVAITPAAGFVGVPQSIFIGTIAAMVSNIVAEVLKHKTGLDDPLDVFACHGVGGMMGMLLTGVFGNKAVNSLVLDGQFLIQLKGMALAVGYSFIVSFLIFKFINFILPMRVTAEEEEEGLDASQHDEKYVQGTLLVKNGGALEEKPAY